MVDEGLPAQGPHSPPLTREQSFVIGAMTFLECLASIIIDQPVDTLKYLRSFTIVPETQRIYPNPWTGVSTPLFIILAEVATLIRQKRNLSALGSPESHAESLAEMDVNMTRSARDLFNAVLAHRTPPIARMEETKDANTPLQHLVAIDCIFRLITLLELSQSFPDVVLDETDHILTMPRSREETRKVGLDLGIAALKLIVELPKTSGSLIMLSIPLVSAGSVLQSTQSSGFDYNLDSVSFSGLCKDVTDLINRPMPLATWRDQVELRLDLLERRVGLAPVRRIRELLKTVWRQADALNTVGGDETRSSIHWMDVMIEESLETLLG